MNPPQGRGAVVVGASIAGLVAARVLSQRFDRVVVLDRDVLPDGPRTRRGVPQGAHAHGLLAVGLTALEDLFAGLGNELVEHGGVWVDAGSDLALWHFGAFRIRYDSGVKLIIASRPLLEWCIRRRVEALPNVVLRTEWSVVGLLGEPGERVTGVTLAGGATIAGDLVVDATGRGERCNSWLAELGFDGPAESTIGIRLGYATRLLRRGDADIPGALAVAIAPNTYAEKRFGAVIPIEADRWLVTLGGFHGDYPGADPAEYQAFADSLPHPMIADLLRRAEPLSDVVPFRFPASRWRHFERLARLPAGFVAIGDSVCSFNPLYGQGITVATLEAVALGAVLDRHHGAGSDLVRAFHRQAAKIVSAAWELARAADFQYPQTEGRKPVALAARNWYMRQAVTSCQVSPRVNDILLRVQHLLLPASALAKPANVVAVLRAARTAGKAVAADQRLPPPVIRRQGARG